MRSVVQHHRRGPFLDLSALFPDGMFAYFTLRGFSGPLDAEGLGAFLWDMGHGEVSVAAVRQVHSGRVVEAPDGCPEADAVVVRGSGRAARVVVADCVPVLLARKDGLGCAAVHAGWKGTLAGIAASGARLLCGDCRFPLTAYIGPAIGPCCYSVPEERKEAFRMAFPGLCGERLGPRGRLDLPGINRALLMREGLAPEEIWTEECCTACSPELCWSYRRDPETTGRMAALIGRPQAGRPGPA